MSQFCSIVHQVVQKQALRTPDKIALREIGGSPCNVRSSLTYKQLQIAVKKAIKLIARECGVAQVTAEGARIAMISDNCVDNVVLLLASAAVGAVVIAVDFMAPKSAWEDILKDCSPAFVLTRSVDKIQLGQSQWKQIDYDLDSIEIQEKDVEMIEKAIGNNNIDMPWSIIYTSGTTSGRRKGAIRTQRSIIDGFWNHLYNMRFGEKDTFMTIYPFHGVSTFFFSMLILYFGGDCIITSRKDSLKGNILLEILESYQVTFTTAGPAQLVTIIESAEEKGKQVLETDKAPKQLLVSGAMTSTGTQQRIRAFFKASSFFEVYGSTECGLITILAPHDDAPGSVGVEPPGVKRIEFIDPASGERVAGDKENPGEILAWTPMMFSGYWQLDDLTQQTITSDQYFRTGDMGYRDENGYIFLLGRQDDRINLAQGQSFYPAEVERIILGHDGVSQTFVYWSAHENCLVALVVPNMSGRELSAQELSRSIRHRCTQYLGDSMLPACFGVVDSVDSLPRTGTGKVLRNKLNEWMKNNPNLFHNITI